MNLHLWAFTVLIAAGSPSPASGPTEAAYSFGVVLVTMHNAPHRYQVWIAVMLRLRVIHRCPHVSHNWIQSDVLCCHGYGNRKRLSDKQLIYSVRPGYLPHSNDTGCWNTCLDYTRIQLSTDSSGLLGVGCFQYSHYNAANGVLDHCSDNKYGGVQQKPVTSCGCT